MRSPFVQLEFAAFFREDGRRGEVNNRETFAQGMAGLRQAGAGMSAGVRQRYEARVAAGEIEPDPAQRSAADRFDALADELAAWAPRERGGLFARFQRKASPTPRGLYVHGGVGRGKTMLMDLFFETAHFQPKRRRHFHEFMAEVHERIAIARQTSEGDPIPRVAVEMVGSPGLLCFDELHVTDIADAMILGRFFKVVFERKVVIVATSNARPNELYRHGLNRQLFLPFIDLIEDNMDVVELEAAKDFRLDKISGQRLYFTPPDKAATEALDQHWSRLTGQRRPKADVIEVKGRPVAIPAAAAGVARFGFADLCERPLGASDYLAIAHAYHTVIVDGIPLMDGSRRDHARRFITLIDTFYDNGVCLIASAEAPPDRLYVRGDGADLFERTASRLIEMQSEAYIAQRDLRANRVSQVI